VRTTRGLVFAVLLGPLLATARPARLPSFRQLRHDPGRHRRRPDRGASRRERDRHPARDVPRGSVDSQQCEVIDPSRPERGRHGDSQRRRQEPLRPHRVERDGYDPHRGLGASREGEATRPAARGGGMTLANSSPTLRGLHVRREHEPGGRRGRARLVLKPDLPALQLYQQLRSPVWWRVVITGGSRLRSWVARSGQHSRNGNATGKWRSHSRQRLLADPSVLHRHRQPGEVRRGRHPRDRRRRLGNGTATLRIEDFRRSTATPRPGRLLVEPRRRRRRPHRSQRARPHRPQPDPNNTANTGGGVNAALARYEIQSSIIEGNKAEDPANVGGFGGRHPGPVERRGDLGAARELGGAGRLRRAQQHRPPRWRAVHQRRHDLWQLHRRHRAKATLSMTDSLVDGNTATTRAAASTRCAEY